MSSKTDENGEWGRLHNVECHSLYWSPNIVKMIKSRKLRWAGHVTKLEEGRSIFKFLAGKPTGKSLLGWLMHRWEDSINIDLKVISIRRIGLIQFWKGIFEDPL